MKIRFPSVDLVLPYRTNKVISVFNEGRLVGSECESIELISMETFVRKTQPPKTATVFAISLHSQRAGNKVYYFHCLSYLAMP